MIGLAVSNQEIIKKYRGHLKHLNQAYYGLSAKYTLLEPMLFNKELMNRNNNRGFDILRQSLLFSCILDIVSLIYKKDKRTPSIEQIGEIFCNKNILEQLHSEIIKHPSIEGVDFYEKYMSDFFWKNIDNAKSSIDILLHSQKILAFEKLRDKRIAHLELKLTNNDYKLLDVLTLELKWEDIGTAIEEIKNILELLNPVLNSTTLGVGIEHINQRMKNEFFQSAFGVF